MLFHSSPSLLPLLSSLTLDEVAAAADMILAAAAKEGVGHESSDERKMDMRTMMGRGQLTVSLAIAAMEVRVWRSSEPTPFFVSLEAVAQIPRPPASAPL